MITASDVNCIESEAINLNLNNRFNSKSSGFMSDTTPLRESTESTTIFELYLFFIGNN